MSRTAVIGVGNSWRGDDGAGLEVARRLAGSAARRRRGAQQDGSDQLALLEAWREAQDAVVVDAARTGAPAGTVHRFDADGGAAARRACSRSSTHAFGVAEAIELARALGRLPRLLLVYAIEGYNFAVGEGLTPEVQLAVADVVEELRSRWPAPSGPL